MKKFLLPFVILFSTNCIAQTKQPIIIDGKINDWSLPLQYFNAETKLNYSITNDDSAFYFCIRATEENTQMRLTQFGFQLSIDPNGKKKQKFNLIYKPERKMSPGGGLNGKPLQETIKNEFRQKLLLVSLNGFTGIANETYISKDMKTVQFAMDWDSSKMLNIEYKVPFSAISYDSTMKQLSFGIILFAMEMPSGGMQPPDGMGSSSPSGISMPQGNGMPPGGMNGMNDMFSEKNIWTKFKVLISK
jgi:hypothetical protein